MRRPPKPGEVSVSIKVRVDSGCFHREHSPRAYELIDEALTQPPASMCSFEEHESGPEILAYVVVGVGLATALINLVTAIIKARSEGIKKGDHPTDPVVLIVRRDEPGGVKEEIVLRISSTDRVQKKQIADAIAHSLRKLIGEPKNKR